MKAKSPVTSTTKTRRWKQSKVPWRFKQVAACVTFMAKRYSKINHYFAMNYHCPVHSAQPPSESSHHQVSSYVKAFVNTLVPAQMWGSVENKNVVFRGIDLFVRLRRFEDITLHQVLQGFQVLFFLSPLFSLFLCFLAAVKVEVVSL